MPQASLLDRLPQDLRVALRQRVLEQGYHDYDGHYEWLVREIEARHLDIETSRSAVYRAIKRRQALDQISEVTADSEAIVEALGDERGDRESALTALLQTHLFQAMLDGDELPIADLARAARAIKETTDSSQKQKELRRKIEREMHDELEKMKKKSESEGLDLKTIERIQQIYGL